MNIRIFKIAVFLICAFTIISCASNKQEDVISSTQDSVEQTKRGPQREGSKGQHQRERPAFADLLNDMDANKDGLLSSTEVQGPLKEIFSKVDSNGDGSISEEEFSNMSPPSRGRGGRG